MDLKTTLKKSIGNTTKILCLVFLITVFFFSPASATEKVETIDLIETTFLPGASQSITREQKKNLDNPIALEAEKKADDLSSTYQGHSSGNTKLYLLYRSLKLFD